MGSVCCRVLKKEKGEVSSGTTTIDPSKISTLPDLQEFISYRLRTSVFPSLIKHLIYLRDTLTSNLNCATPFLHHLPTTGIVKECLNSEDGSNLVKHFIEEDDPIYGLLQPCSFSGKESVVCSVWKQDSSHFAVIIVLCEQFPSEENFSNLSSLQTQAAAIYCKIESTMSASNAPTCDSPMSILNLCADLYDDDVHFLQIKLNKYLMEKLKCQCSCFLLVDEYHRELACQVFGMNILDFEFRWAINEASFQKAMEEKDIIDHADMSKTCREAFENRLRYKIVNLLGVPLVHRGTNSSIGMCVLFNKTSTVFNARDITIVQECYKYTSSVLNSTIAIQRERLLKNETQILLEVAKNLFSNLEDLKALLLKIMTEARNITKAERCSVFLLEADSNELVSKVFDGDAINTSEVRIPKSQGVAGMVATTGKLVNIDDAYSHPLFYRKIDETTGFRTRNILCFPIKDEKGEVLGVAQLCNKMGGAGFSIFDEEIARAFSVYCGISIMHSLMYKKVNEAQFRSRLASEVMMYHMKVDPTNVTTYTGQPILPPTAFSPDFCGFGFIARALPDDQTTNACVTMFEDMGYITKFKIKRLTLIRFLLMVKRGYRDLPYHNWAHAFGVGHFSYALFKNVNLNDFLSDLEILSLYVACLCHDIDHRGTNNNYQKASQSVLAQLYSSQGSVLERHHFAQTMCILNTEDCNIFDALSSKEYERVVNLIQHIILSTDLNNHFKSIKEEKSMIQAVIEYRQQIEKPRPFAGPFGWDNTKHHNLLLSLIMTCCDLSDQTKHWANAKSIAYAIYQEFFFQGDMEKQMGQTPIGMMDRDNACVPQEQIGFLNHVALPAYRMLSQIFPSTQCVVDVIEANRANWARLDEKANKMNYNKKTLEILELDDSDITKNDTSGPSGGNSKPTPSNKTDSSH